MTCSWRGVGAVDDYLSLLLGVCRRSSRVTMPPSAFTTRDSVRASVLRQKERVKVLAARLGSGAPLDARRTLSLLC